MTVTPSGVFGVSRSLVGQGGYACASGVGRIDPATAMIIGLREGERVVADATTLVISDIRRPHGTCTPLNVLCGDDTCASYTSLDALDAFAHPIGLRDGYVYALGQPGIVRCSMTTGESPNQEEVVADGISGGVMPPPFWYLGTDTVYVVKADNSIWAAPLGGTAASIYTSPTVIRGFAVDGSTIYWTTANGIFSCSTSMGGCTPMQVIATADAAGLVLDTTGLYWIAGENLMHCGVEACAATATRIAACGRSPDIDVYNMFSTYGFTAPFFVAADDTHLYCPRPAAVELPHDVIRLDKPGAQR